jgi:hypothetical protein
MMRHGQCNRCGMCCIEAWRFHYFVDHPKGEKLDWSTIRVKNVRKGKQRFLPCEKLVFDIRTHEAICLVHGSGDKPQVCQLFPTSPAEIIFGSCGYRFEEEDHERSCPATSG